MEIYFIRHGETDFNKRHVHQPDDAPLNERGRQQAEFAKIDFDEIRATYLIASTHTRALETAEILNADGALDMEINELFRELERPKHIQGRKHFGLHSLIYIGQWFTGMRATYFEKKGGESRAAFLDRLKAAKNYLETLPEDARVVVVSHSVFINFFIEHICNEKPIPAKDAFFLLMKITNLPNSSISHCSYNPDFGEGVCKWSILPTRAEGTREL